MTLHDRLRTLTVWREGTRIRRADSVGYSDRVTDDEIWGHIARHVEYRDRAMIRFCLDVLALRDSERHARAQDVPR